MKQLGFSEKLFMFPKFLAIFGANERKSGRRERGGWCLHLSLVQTWHFCLVFLKNFRVAYVAGASGISF